MCCVVQVSLTPCLDFGCSGCLLLACLGSEKSILIFKIAHFARPLFCFKLKQVEDNPLTGATQ